MCEIGNDHFTALLNSVKTRQALSVPHWRVSFRPCGKGVLAGCFEFNKQFAKGNRVQFGARRRAMLDCLYPMYARNDSGGSMATPVMLGIASRSFPAGMGGG